jgi:hypothetical protein
MLKLTSLFLLSAVLTAGTIQQGTNGFEVTTSVAGPSPANGAGGENISTIDVPFYFAGSTLDLLHVFVSNGIEGLSGPFCTGTGFPSCDVGFFIGAAVNGVPAFGFNLDTNDFGGDVGGSLGGVVGSGVVDGLNVAEITTTLFLTGLGIQDPQVPFTATVEFASGAQSDTVEAIPEPSTWGLAFVGIAAVVVWSRRQSWRRCN